MDKLKAEVQSMQAAMEQSCHPGARQSLRLAIQQSQLDEPLALQQAECRQAAGEHGQEIAARTPERDLEGQPKNKRWALHCLE